MRPAHSAAAVAFTVHGGPVKKVAHVVTIGKAALAQAAQTVR